jgi:hypothetical protein
MKRSFLLLFSLILVSEAFGVDFKFLGGANLSSYSIYPTKIYWGWSGNYDRYDSSYQPGFLLGAGLEWPLAKRIALEIDVLYFRKGSKITLSRFDAVSLKGNYVLNVISVPVLIKIKALPNSSPYIVHGGELSYTLSHEYSYTTYPDSYYEIGPQHYPPADIKESTRRLSLGVVIGAGWEIQIRGISLLVEARYHFGLVNILSENQGEYDLLESIKPNSQAILCALKF